MSATTAWRPLGALVAAALLAGCGSDGLEDLRDFTQRAHADRPARLDPVPQLAPQEAFSYSAMDRPDPFSPGNLRPVLPNKGPVVERSRRQEALEEFPLDALKMVGTLSRGGQTWAIVQAPDGGTHPVKVGSAIGQSMGKVVRITEARIDVREQIQGALGEWVPREANIVLSE